MTTVLIVEDSPSMRQLIAFALRKLPNTSILEAEDGVQALKVLGGSVIPDILLVDVNMPQMDGLKLVKLIRADEKFNHVPIVMITTEGGAEDRERAMALGANGYITKPIQATDVNAVVKDLLKLT